MRSRKEETVEGRHRYGEEQAVSSHIVQVVVEMAVLPTLVLPNTK